MTRSPRGIESMKLKSTYRRHQEVLLGGGLLEPQKPQGPQEFSRNPRTSINSRKLRNEQYCFWWAFFCHTVIWNYSGLALSFMAAWNDNTTGICFAILTGLNRQNMLQASVLAITSAVLVIGGTLTCSIFVFNSPLNASNDFLQKGTISNASQDATTPHGRLWVTALVISAVLLLSSMYPLHIYRCWQPWVKQEENPLVHAVFLPKQERFIKSLWAVLPNVGFILTALIPSISEAQGYKIAFTGVHNTCAPLSMLFCMVMETIQLSFGENAVTYLFSQDPTPLYGTLKIGQRVRVMTACFGWTFGILFVALQGYLYLFTNTRLWVAMMSYYCEVLGIICAFALPAISGMDYLMWMDENTVLEEAKDKIRTHLSKPHEESAKKED